MALKQLILASASPRRLELLAQIGITPNLVAPTHIDETPQKGESALGLVTRLATQKALASNETGLVLAADTIVVCGGKILGKPTDAHDARAMLAKLSGRKHKVITAIALMDSNNKNNIKCKSITTKVKFKQLSQEDIDSYIKSDEWNDKAGGYAIQGLAGKFVKSIQGSYSNVVGLPLYETANMLAGFGYKH